MPDGACKGGNCSKHLVKTVFCRKNMYLCTKETDNERHSKRANRLTEILENAVKISEKATNRKTRNQKQFEKLIVLKYGEAKLTVGFQRSTQEMVQYCITVPQDPNSKNKATTEK